MKKNYKIPTFLLILTLGIYSCEGMRCAEGVVKDKATGLPLDSVYVKVASNDRYEKYTDSTGAFDACNPFGGCVPKCRDIMIEFSKPGYKNVILENPDSGDVFLEKL